jgi:hypothetical protein
MDGNHIVRQFERMGARARFAQSGEPSGRVRLDIVRDREGQLFTIDAGRNIEVRVVDTRADQRHLLLFGHDLGNGEKHKFLCGHDEREWFVAAVPGSPGVSNVSTAMEALKPPMVRFEQERLGVRTDRRRKRRTEAYTRQGEWFFVPRPGVKPASTLVLKNEPMRRGGGKAHWAELLFRTGGELVYVSHSHPNGITENERQQLFRTDAEARKRNWITMRRNPEVYVKGRISHPHHATITLECWHQVLMNTEHQARAMRHVAFLD